MSCWVGFILDAVCTKWDVELPLNYFDEVRLVLVNTHLEL